MTLGDGELSLMKPEKSYKLSNFKLHESLLTSVMFI